MTTPTTTAAAGDDTPGRPARVLGLDGKTYPPGRLSGEDQHLVVGHVHALRHLDRLSVRQIRSRLEDDLCIRRSVGWISTVLTTWTCDRCQPAVQVVGNGAPEHPVYVPDG